jgi:signal peptidase II
MKGKQQQSPPPFNPTPGEETSVRSKASILSFVFITVIALDIITKRWAMDSLSDGSSEMLGGLVPLTLMYNRGAAFGLSVGGDPRWFFIPVTVIALVLLGVLLLRTDFHDRFRLFALSLVFSGAFGNLIDRVRWNRGVVDFLGPIDLGFMDWPIFNVADMAISCGAVALAISFWTEEQGAEETAAEVPAKGEPETTG